MSAKTIGDSSCVILCSGISGSGSGVTYSVASGDSYQFIKAKTPEISVVFNSTVTHSGYHKSRIYPDLKFVQSYNVTDGVFKASEANDTTEWLVESFINKKKIYLLIDYYNGSTWVKKSWYDHNNAKVYYLKGVLKSLRLRQKFGQVWGITFQFEEVWL